MVEDHASGATSERPNLTACLDYLRRDDVLVVLDLDRLGRLAGELITLIDALAERGIGFRAINSPMDTATPAGRAFLQIQTAFGEMERKVIRQRVREGVTAVRARGRKGGRPRIVTPEKLRYAQSLTADRETAVAHYQAFKWDVIAKLPQADFLPGPRQGPRLARSESRPLTYEYGDPTFCGRSPGESVVRPTTISRPPVSGCRSIRWTWLPSSKRLPPCRRSGTAWRGSRKAS